MAAAESGQVSVVDTLLQHGASVNVQGMVSTQ